MLVLARIEHAARTFVVLHSSLPEWNQLALDVFSRFHAPQQKTRRSPKTGGILK
jgi:hypothetical protein